MASSIQRVVSDGSLVSLPLSIDYFDRSEISVYFNDILAADAAWDWVGLTDSTITFSPAITAGVTVLVKRTTDTSAPRNVFTEGAQFNSATLDENTNQALRAAQEIQEGSGIKEIFNDINMHGYRVKNVGNAVAASDAIPLGQYLADAAGANAALAAAQALYDAFDDRYLGAKAADPAVDNDGNLIATGALYYNTVVGELRAFNGVSWQIGVGSSLNSKLFSGTGAQVNFTLDSIPSNENNTQVYVNGVYQQKDTYSLVGAVLTFSEAPPAGTDNIEVMTVVTLALGTVAAGNTSYVPTDGVAETNVQSAIARFGSWIKAATTTATALATSAGAATVGVIQSGVGAVLRTVQDKLRERPTPADYGVVADGVTDCTAALNSYFTACAGKVARLPVGDYYFTGQVNVPADTVLRGDGYGSRLHPVNVGGNTMAVGSNCKVENLRMDGSSPGGIKIQGSATNVTVRDVYFRGVSQSVWLFACTQVRVLNCTFDTLFYGVIQQLAYVSSHVLVSGCVAKNMTGDFVEANCATGAPSEDWIITGNQYLGGSAFPAEDTERRFVGITAVKNVTISNNIVKNVQGDAAVHLEDTQGKITVAGNHFVNCVGTNYLYFLHSAKDAIVSNNWFIHDDVSLPAMTLVGMNSGVYTNPVTLVGNHFIGNANMNCTAIGGETHANTKIIGNTFSAINVGVSGSSTTNLLIANNTFDNVNKGIRCDTGAPTGGSTNDVTVSGNRFNCNTNSIIVRRNTSGTSASERWVVTGNYFGADALAFDTLDFVVTGNIVAAGKVLNLGGVQYVGSVRHFQANNLLVGTGLIP